MPRRGAGEGEEAPKRSARDKALDLLARRPHFRRELERKLSSRGYEAADVAAALDQLTSERLIDDASTAADFVDVKLRRGGVGARKLSADLAGRGVASATVAEAVKQLSPEEEFEQARAAAQRWLRTRALADDRDRAALGRFLERRGFPSQIVYRILRESGEVLAED